MATPTIDRPRAGTAATQDPWTPRYDRLDRPAPGERTAALGSAVTSGLLALASLLPWATSAFRGTAWGLGAIEGLGVLVTSLLAAAMSVLSLLARDETRRGWLFGAATFAGLAALMTIIFGGRHVVQAPGMFDAAASALGHTGLGLGWFLALPLSIAAATLAMWGLLSGRPRPEDSWQ